MKTKEIRDLIDFISKSGLNEVNIETDELKLSVKRNPITQVIESHITPPLPPAAPGTTSVPPVVQSTSESSPAAEASEAPSGPSTDNYVEIKSPMIGTFYRSQNPESDPFLSVGDVVKAGQPVCIIEAMKLFNEIESEISGTVVKILVDDTTPVEYDQPLFLIDPS